MEFGAIELSGGGVLECGNHAAGAVHWARTADDQSKVYGGTPIADLDQF